MAVLSAGSRTWRGQVQFSIVFRLCFDCWSTVVRLTVGRILTQLVVGRLKSGGSTMSSACLRAHLSEPNCDVRASAHNGATVRFHETAPQPWPTAVTGTPQRPRSKT